ncbi:protein kinase RIO2 [Ascoidea rubescens DSM 1968]|uniref:Serine/threonine-protein kinase RIO2 n=1 Tax=Ascoidea rubescens DSM 1968 TaxID=1344418 RepID=A0A1D2VM03_9ASCO|nr:serine/threonine-protein kinase RIO2 [Ascoidea rubescens DSM 1968]ODV62646.1 serine/threonine-protein kinase RIO2 [Ascoidea rubescens DSM 1968]
MKLSPDYMRYLSSDDFRTLTAVELGSRNHEIVPTNLIYQISKVSSSLCNRCISNLAKLKLIGKVRNAKYDGYRLTFSGYDFLALKSMVNRENIYSLGTIIGVGKESDIYSISDKTGQQKILKVVRLGRTSFRTVKKNRDYLKNRKTTNWMYLSRLAAEKEYEFLKILYDSKFNVPIPYDYSRHCILMEWVNGFQMKQLKEHFNYKKLYSDLMKFIVKLANYGLIHCDFNEFNIMIRNEEDLGKFNEDFVVIDFPQSISIDHVNHEYYFNRDVECIKRFFKRKFNYEPYLNDKYNEEEEENDDDDDDNDNNDDNNKNKKKKQKNNCVFLDTDGYGDGFKYSYPVFKRDVKRIGNLDVQVMAKKSTYSKNNYSTEKELEEAVNQMRNHEIENYNEESDINDEDGYELEGEFEDAEIDYYENYDEDELDSEDELDRINKENKQLEEENEEIIKKLIEGVEDLKMDKFGNYILNKKDN